MNDTVRSEYRELTKDEQAHVAAIKALGQAFLVSLDRRLDGRKGGEREFAIARTKAEEAVMWAVKGATG